MDDRDKRNKDYIQNKVNPILEKMIVEMLIHKPDDALSYMIKWLQDKGPKILEERNKAGGANYRIKNAYGEESDEDEEDEEVEDLDTLKKNKMNNKNFRTSVSAEAYGQFNKKGDYKPKEIQKTKSQIERIKARLSQAFMFNSLEEKDQEIVIRAFEEKSFKASDVVIRQGDDGDNLYIVDSGQLDCFKKFSKDADPQMLKVYEPGDSFGELALLYNAPRAATIIAKTDSVCFALDRECFNHIVKDSATKKREKYEMFLAKIELLDQMDPYERSKIADALRPMKFAAGEYIVREGEKGDTFFFLEEGECFASKILEKGASPQVVYDYKAGDYFGELALLRDTPRAASIIAKTDIKVVAMDRQSFKRLLGPLEEILKRNFGRYDKFMH